MVHVKRESPLMGGGGLFRSEDLAGEALSHVVDVARPNHPLPVPAYIFSLLWEDPPYVYHIASVVLAFMEERAVLVVVRGTTPGGASVGTRGSLIVVWVELLLLPTVAVLTSRFDGTAFLVCHDEGPALPVRAHCMVVVEEMGLPSEVLPVMGVHALRLVVVSCEGTPGCLEIEEEEVLVLGTHKVQQRDFDVLL